MPRLTFDWIQLAELLGSLQGLLLAGALVAARRNRTANRLLAALMLAFTIYLSSGPYYGTALFRAWPHFFGLSYLTPWLFGPLVYLYARAASDRAWHFERRHLAHFLPVTIVAALLSPFYMMSGAMKVSMFERLSMGEVPLRMAVLDPTKYLSGLAYSVLTALYLRQHRRRVEETYSNIARVNLRWLLWLAAAAGVIWVLATTLRITDFGHRLRDDDVSLAIALVVYAIGYMGLRQPEIFTYHTAEFAVAGVAHPPALPSSDPTPTRYERSGLGDDEATALDRSLRRLMDDEQPWKDSELTLPDLAARLDTTPHKLSEVLNAQVGQTFYDFVNGYRVREVQRRIEAGEARRRKMLALALDAGFASKSTFNDAFKKHTSMTPSGFRSRAEANG